MVNSFLVHASIVAVSLCLQLSSTAQDSLGAAAAAPDSKAANKAPAHDPPQILIAAAIDEDENLSLVNIKSIYIGSTGAAYNDRSLSKTSLYDVRVFTVDGRRLSLAELRIQLDGKDTPIICSSW